MEKQGHPDIEPDPVDMKFIPFLSVKTDPQAAGGSGEMKRYISALRHTADHSPPLQTSKIRIGTVREENRIVDIRRSRVHNIQIKCINFLVNIPQAQIGLFLIRDKICPVFCPLQSIPQGNSKTVRLPAVRRLSGTILWIRAVRLRAPCRHNSPVRHFPAARAVPVAVIEEEEFQQNADHKNHRCPHTISGQHGTQGSRPSL